MNQQSSIMPDLQGVYGSYVQKCIQSYIHGNTLPDIKKVFTKAPEEKVKVWEKFATFYITAYVTAASYPS